MPRANGFAFRSQLPRCPASGATLAELMIVLYILGLLSVYTLPKVLTAQSSAREKAVLRESVAAAQTAIMLSKRTGDFQVGHYLCPPSGSRPAPIDLTIIANRLNYIRKDESTAIKQYWLANGASVSFYLGWHIDTIVDVNGTDPPNLYGQDRVIFYFTDCQGTLAGIPTGKFGMHISQPVGFVAENKALWESIFSSG